MSAPSTRIEKLRETPRPFFERFYPFGFVLPALLVIGLFTICRCCTQFNQCLPIHF
jgi:hypothetical protein